MKRCFFAALFLLWFSAPALATVTCTFFVDSTASGDDSGSSWANAYPNIFNNTPVDWTVLVNDGDVVCVSDAHAETHANVITVIGEDSTTTAKPTILLCVDESGCTGGGLDICTRCDVVGSSEFATVTTTTANDKINLNGKLYLYGIYFYTNEDFHVAESDAADTVVEEGRIEIVTGVAAGDTIQIGGAVADRPASLTLINTDIDFADTDQGITLGGNFLMQGGTWEPASLAVIIDMVGRGPDRNKGVFRDVDFSAMSGDFVDVSAMDSQFSASFERCEIHASADWTDDTAIKSSGSVITFHHMQSGSVTDPPYQMAEFTQRGSVQTTTTNVRTGGASDGTTAYSWVLATSDGQSFMAQYEPLCSLTPIPVWVSGGSEITATVYFNSTAGMDDTEIFVRASLPPVGATSKGVYFTSRPDPGESASVYLAEGTETWTSGTDYELDITFTPAENGVLLVWPCSATSDPVYVDPKIAVS